MLSIPLARTPSHTTHPFRFLCVLAFTVQTLDADIVGQQGQGSNGDLCGRQAFPSCHCRHRQRGGDRESVGGWPSL